MRFLYALAASAFFVFATPLVAGIPYPKKDKENINMREIDLFLV